jgi:hypothetical protein
MVPMESCFLSNIWTNINMIVGQNTRFGTIHKHHPNGSSMYGYLESWDTITLTPFGYTRDTQGLESPWCTIPSHRIGKESLQNAETECMYACRYI